VKDERPATQDEKNYAFRRVVYDAMIAARGVVSFNNIDGYSSKESMKLAALIMARNLDAFFFQLSYSHDDDINYTDFGLSSWTPDTSAKLTKSVRKRINKVVGHVVSSKPDPFKNPDEVDKIVLPLICQASEFVRACLQDDVAKYTGKSGECRRRLNGILKRLGIAELPEN